MVDGRVDVVLTLVMKVRRGTREAFPEAAGELRTSHLMPDPAAASGKIQSGFDLCLTVGGSTIGQLPTSSTSLIKVEIKGFYVYLTYLLDMSWTPRARDEVALHHANIDILLYPRYLRQCCSCAGQARECQAIREQPR